LSKQKQAMQMAITERKEEGEFDKEIKGIY
jgi:hypothetical protein